MSTDAPTTEPELMTPAEATRMLRVSPTWLYDAAKDGRIPAIRLGGPGGPVRFVRADLLAHIEQTRARWRPGDTSSQTLRRAAEREAA